MAAILDAWAASRPMVFGILSKLFLCLLRKAGGSEWFLKKLLKECVSIVCVSNLACSLPIGADQTMTGYPRKVLDELRAPL